jgi:hypothetical protein
VGRVIDGGLLPEDDPIYQELMIFSVRPAPKQVTAERVGVVPLRAKAFGAPRGGATGTRGPETLRNPTE